MLEAAESRLARLAVSAPTPPCVPAVPAVGEATGEEGAVPNPVFEDEVEVDAALADVSARARAG
jgi:hypothetical protein